MGWGVAEGGGSEEIERLGSAWFAIGSTIKKIEVFLSH